MGNSKTLIVLRHAKSSWEETDKSDFDRALKDRGIKEICLLAQAVKETLGGIDTIFSSPANRAIHTAILFAQTIGFPTENIRIIEGLYETNELYVEGFVKSLPDEMKSVAIVGHNPTSTDFVNLFLEQGIDNIPTSGLVKLIFNTNSWKGISRSSLTSSFFDFPKNHQ